MGRAWTKFFISQVILVRLEFNLNNKKYLKFKFDHKIYKTLIYNF